MWEVAKEDVVVLGEVLHGSAWGMVDLVVFRRVLAVAPLHLKLLIKLVNCGFAVVIDLVWALIWVIRALSMRRGLHVVQLA